MLRIGSELWIMAAVPPGESPALYPLLLPLFAAPALPANAPPFLQPDPLLKRTSAWLLSRYSAVSAPANATSCSAGRRCWARPLLRRGAASPQHLAAACPDPQRGRAFFRRGHAQPEWHVCQRPADCRPDAAAQSRSDPALRNHAGFLRRRGGSRRPAQASDSTRSTSATPAKVHRGFALQLPAHSRETPSWPSSLAPSQAASDHGNDPGARRDARGRHLSAQRARQPVRDLSPGRSGLHPAGRSWRRPPDSPGDESPSRRDRQLGHDGADQPHRGQPRNDGRRSHLEQRRRRARGKHSVQRLVDDDGAANGPVAQAAGDPARRM